jgi:succinyl-diaminopimelate desuccinylase
VTSNLLRRTAALVDVASVSHEEAALADLVEARLRDRVGLEVHRFENNVVARTTGSRATRLVLAGHLDTVPPAGNALARIEGDRLFGVGSADMKSGLAVMLDLAETLEDPHSELTFVFYACEEVARRFSGLNVIWSTRPDLLRGDAAIVLEPTSARIEAGCQGVLRLAVTLGGVAAHSARPWVGVNAIHRLGELLSIVAAFEERRPVLEGCEYRETLQAVAVDGGVGTNTLPTSARVVLSHRFAPDRDATAATASLLQFLAPALDEGRGDRVEILESAPAAAPSLDHPLLRALVQASGEPPIAKIAWTDVAFFFERGVPAANFGPGDPFVAHRPDEFVDDGDLARVRRALGDLLGERTTEV